MRWAGEPDVLLKLEPSSKWLLNAVRIGKHLHIQPHMLLQSPGTGDRHQPAMQALSRSQHATTLLALMRI